MRIRQGLDVVVCGGGTAGAIAAIAAARSGARTLLIDQYGTVGGMASTGMSFLGVSDAGGRRALGGIGAELFERLVDVGAAFEDRPDEQVSSVTAADPFALRQGLLTMLAESRVEFLLHSFCVDAMVEGGRVRGVLVANKGGLRPCSGALSSIRRATGTSPRAAAHSSSWGGAVTDSCSR